MNLPQYFKINNSAMLTIGRNSILVKYVDRNYEKSVLIPFSIPIALSIADNTLLKIIANGESVEFSLIEFEGNPKSIVEAFDYVTASHMLTRQPSCLSS